MSRRRWTFVATLVLVAAMLIIRNRRYGESLTFSSLEQGHALRPYEQMQRTQSLYIITNDQEAKDFITVETKLDTREYGQDAYVRIQKVLLNDYKSVFVIIAFHGESSGTNHATRVEQVKRAGNTVNVYTFFRKLYPGEGVTGDIAEGYDIIAIQKNDSWNKKLVFNLIDRDYDQLVASTTHFVP